MTYEPWESVERYENPRFDHQPATSRPALELPDGKRLAFWAGLNIEYFMPGRGGLAFNQATDRSSPDPINEGWRDYSRRVGIWRIMDGFDRLGMRASVLSNSDVCTHYPEIIAEGNKRGWVWVAHGKSNSISQSRVAPEDEPEYLRTMVAAIVAGTGTHPRGWLGPGLSESPLTLDLLAELGIEYDLDWCNDDVPYPMRVRSGRMISVPYSAELNDLTLWNAKGFSGQQIFETIRDQFDVLHDEALRLGPRVMGIGLHPPVMGVAYRFKNFVAAFEYICNHEDVWVTTSDDIATWYYENYYDAPAFLTLELPAWPQGSRMVRSPPNEVLEDALERIARLDGRVNAWSYLDLERARVEAGSLTQEAADGIFRGPLHGVPFGVKDEFIVRGMPTGMRDSPEPTLESEDAACVERLRAAGAVVLGKTDMPVGNRLPPTRNPWNLAHTAGGTSSGSGAAVGARMVAAAIGEQTAGSNLRPAAYCGVVGMKPTYGRISRYGCLPYAWSLDHVGIIALTVADVALVLSVLSGPDPRDPTSLSDEPPAADLSLSTVAAPRIGFVRNHFLERCDDETQERISDAAAALAHAGANVVDVVLPDSFRLTWSAWRVITYVEGSMLDTPQKDSDAPGRYGVGALLPASYYLQARRIRSWLRSELLSCWSNNDVLLMPTTPSVAPEGMGTGDPSLLIPWSLLGLPAISVPVGLSRDGLPIGVQLVAAARNDYALLQSAAWAESVFGRLPAPTLT